MSFESSFNAQSPQAHQRRDAMLARIAHLRALEDRAAMTSAKSRPVFDKRGQLLPRERVALLLDPGTPFLEFSQLAAFDMYNDEAPCAGVITGIGRVAGELWMGGSKISRFF